jgi:hypothetical protein
MKTGITCLLLLISLLAGGLRSSAQGYSRQYYDNRPVMRFAGLEQKNEFTYIAGITAAQDTPHYVKALFGKLDDAGNFIYLRGIMDSLPYSYDLFWNNLKQTTDGSFLMCGEMIDSAGKIFILKMDTIGHIVFKKEYRDSTLDFFQARDIVNLNDGGYLIAANVIITGDQLIMMLHLDSAGNIIGQKWHDLPDKELPWIMRPMLNGNFMVGAVSHNVAPYFTKTWMIEVDNAGGMVSQWLDSDATNMWPYGMEQTADSGWIIVREHLAYNVSGEQYYNASILKMDKLFNKQWEIDTGMISANGGMYDVAILPDGSYICAGANPVNITADSAHMYGWIMKVSTQGEIMWERNYLPDGRYGTFGYLYDIDILPNGDLLACGEIQYTYDIGVRPVQQGWILRTDSNGCVMDNCLVNSVNEPEQNKVSLSIYPNPFTGAFSVAVSNANQQISTITLTNLLGQTVYHQQQTYLSSNYTKTIDLSYLPSGLYFITVEMDGERIVKQVVKQ